MKKGSENTDILRIHPFPPDETDRIFEAESANND